MVKKCDIPDRDRVREYLLSSLNQNRTVRYLRSGDHNVCIVQILSPDGTNTIYNYPLDSASSRIDVIDWSRTAGAIAKRFGHVALESTLCFWHNSKSVVEICCCVVGDSIVARGIEHDFSCVSHWLAIHDVGCLGAVGGSYRSNKKQRSQNGESDWEDVGDGCRHEKELLL